MLDMASTLDYYGVDYHPARTTQKVLCPVHGEMDPSCNVDMEKGLWYCLPPETRVLTGDLRYVPLSSVAVGDRLAGFDEHPSVQSGRSLRRHWRESVVERIGRIEQPCYEIRLSNGDVLTSSGGHMWLASDSAKRVTWHTTEALSRARGVRRLHRVLDVWQRPDTWDAGYIAAALDGEGCYVNGGKKKAVYLSFTQRPNAMLSEFHRATGGGLFEYGKPISGNSRYAGRSDVREVRITGKAEVVRTLGTYRPAHLLAKFSFEDLGEMRAIERPDVLSVTPIGVREVVAIETSTGTLVAEGYATHNCHSCGEGGTALDLVMKKEGLDFESARTFAADSGIESSGVDGRGDGVQLGLVARKRLPGAKGDQRPKRRYTPPWGRH